MGVLGLSGTRVAYTPVQRIPALPPVAAGKQEKASLPRDRLTLSVLEADNTLYDRAGKTLGQTRRAEKERLEKQTEPCQTCVNRKYKDGSTDAGVSFKSASGVAPQAAASAVVAHERQHEGNARERAGKADAQAQTSVRLFTGICPECKKVYVSGGVTNTRIVKPEDAADAYQKQMDILLDALPTG